MTHDIVKAHRRGIQRRAWLEAWKHRRCGTRGDLVVGTFVDDLDYTLLMHGFAQLIEWLFQ